MKIARNLSIYVGLIACAVLVLPAQVAPAKNGVPAVFRAEGSSYVVTVSATGATQAAAEEKARGAALNALFSGLGKDRLFGEVFVGSPPVGLSYKVDSSVKEIAGTKVSMTLRVDDESIRIIERGPYLIAAMALLDKAVLAAASAEAQLAEASAAESNGLLGDALGAYGMAQEASRSGLSLIDAIGDGTVYSSKAHRSAPELRRSLAAVQSSVTAGLERVKKAEASLIEDEAGRAASEAVDRALAAADTARALGGETEPIVGDVTNYSAERLIPLRDRLSVGLRSLDDAKAALERAAPSLPKERGFLKDKLEFARRRLATEKTSLEAAFRTVDREIRDPAVRRAARAQALRWAFLHVPKEYLSIRAYLPFEVAAGKAKDAVSLADFDLNLGMEGAFKMGSSGLWVRTRLDYSDIELSSAVDGKSLSQSFDMGFYGRSLWFAGFGWDWMRSASGTSVTKPGQVKLGLGGVSAEAAGFPRADFLLALSWDIPVATKEVYALNILNAGLEAQFRLGTVGILEASIEHRAYSNPASAGSGLDAVFSWSAGAGIRLPAPFLIGAEFSGDLARPIKADGSTDEGKVTGGGRFRFYLGYSL